MSASSGEPDLRHLFDVQVRRGTSGDGVSLVEATPRVVRWSAVGQRGWSEIAWSNLDASNARDVIAEQIAHFQSLEQRFVRRLRNSDRPRDLASHLDVEP